MATWIVCKKILAHLLHAPWALSLCVLIRVLRPIKTVKIGTFPASRIGHFVADSVVTWRKFRTRRDRPLALVWLPDKTANEFWEKLVRRNFLVRPWFKYADFWNRKLPFADAHILDEVQYGSRDGEGTTHFLRGNFELLPDEDAAARGWLRNKGWKEGEPFVCFVVRDGFYLESIPELSESRDWSYHFHRNSNIEDYVPAMEYLLSEGVWVFRMGKAMRHPTPLRHVRFVDFAFDPTRTDLIDVWLFAHCDLCVTTGTGVDMISDSHGVYMVDVNCVGPYEMRTWAQGLYAGKHMTWSGTGRTLTIHEQIENTLQSGYAIANRGIEIRDLSAREILAVVREGWMRSRGTWLDSPSDMEVRRRYWSCFLEHRLIVDRPEWYNPNYHPARAWLRSLPDGCFATPSESQRASSSL